jgi:hypothetical protein
MRGVAISGEMKKSMFFAQYVAMSPEWGCLAAI